MPDAPTHEIVLRGRLGLHVLGPFLDDFTINHDQNGVTRLSGFVRDSSHLHGLVAYLASINAELISISPHTSTAPITVGNPPSITSTSPTRSNS